MGLIFEDPQLAKRDLIHLLFNELHKFKETKNLLSWNEDECLEFLKYIQGGEVSKILQERYNCDVLAKYNDALIPVILSFVLLNNGKLPALDAFIGGIVCQEILKGITRKYSPI